MCDSKIHLAEVKNNMVFSSATEMWPKNTSITVVSVDCILLATELGSLVALTE